MKMNAVIPANTTATLYLPLDGRARVFESGKLLQNSNGIMFIKYEKGYGVYRLESGTYRFDIKK